MDRERTTCMSPANGTGLDKETELLCNTNSDETGEGERLEEPRIELGGYKSRLVLGTGGRLVGYAKHLGGGEGLWGRNGPM